MVTLKEWIVLSVMVREHLRSRIIWDLLYGTVTKQGVLYQEVDVYTYPVMTYVSHWVRLYQRLGVYLSLINLSG